MEALASVSELGGYGITYLDERDNVLCSECASKVHEDGEKVTPFIHWEGDSLHCEDCNVEIESEYGNPDEA